MWRMTHHDQLALDILDTLQAVVGLALAERAAVDVGGEEADGGAHALVEGAAESEMAAQAHARRADAPVARRQRQQRIHAQPRVLVVRRNLLRDLQLVALVRAGPVVRQRLRARELVVRRHRRRDVALARDLAREAGDRAGHWGGRASIRLVFGLGEQVEGMGTSVWERKD